MSVSRWWRIGISCAAFSAFTMSASYASLPRVSPGNPVQRAAVFHGVVDASRVPQETYRDIIQRPRPLLNITGFSATKMEQLKQVARRHAPIPNGLPSSIGESGARPFLGVPQKFTGLGDSASICPYFGGCAPPDGA